MGNVTRNAILRALLEGAITDLMVKTKVENVFVDDTTTLAAKLSEIITSLNNKATTDALTSGLAAKSNTGHGHAQSDVSGLEAALSIRPTNAEMQAAISTAITNLVDGAPDAYNTLKEIADYIASHADVIDTLNAAIGNKADASTVASIQTTIRALGSLSKKSIVSESDLDANLKSKVNAASEGNHSHENKSVLDGIDSTDVTNWNGKGKFYAQATQPANMTSNDLWAQLI